MSPCQSDYLEPTRGELYRQATAQHYSYALTAVDMEVPDEVSTTARTIYAHLDFTMKLCKLIETFTTEQMDQIVYNGRSQDARSLADWWELHQAADQARAEQEAQRAKDDHDRVGAIAKLTPRERKLLGIREERLGSGGVIPS